MTLTEEILLFYNQKGLIPGPNENEQNFQDRAEYCLNLKNQLPDEVISLPLYPEELHATEEILKKGCEVSQHFYDISPSWVPLFFSNFKLTFWQGGCAWIFQQKQDSPVSAFFQLRRHFKNSNQYMGLYNRTEFLCHELAHVGRMMFEEPKFEEILAYRSSKISFRRYFGSIVQSSVESVIFVLLLLFVIFMDIFAFIQNDVVLLSIAHGGRLLILACLGYGLIRLWKRQSQFEKCLNQLKKTLFHVHHAQAVIYRLTDHEIQFFAKSTPDDIKKYAYTQKDLSIRWKVIYLAYFKNNSPSDHFNGNHYHNNPAHEHSLKSVFKWLMKRKPKPWPQYIEVKTCKPPLNIQGNDPLITFINHSTMLIQWEGVNILTDPIWSKRCSPLPWYGPKRVHVPGVPFENLPQIDVVLISHNHYDHMDLSTLRKLYKTHRPRFITGLGNLEYLYRKGLENINELDWWEEISVNHLQVVFTPAQHFTMRNPWNRNKTLWGGFILKVKNKMLYFAGDTAYNHVFKDIKNKYGSPSIAFLPIGAFEPREFMKIAHMSPEEAVQAHQDLAAKKSIAMHFGTFQLSDESYEAPPLLLKEKLFKIGIPDAFWIPKPGEVYKPEPGIF